MKNILPLVAPIIPRLLQHRSPPSILLKSLELNPLNLLPLHLILISIQILILDCNMVVIPVEGTCHSAGIVAQIVEVLALGHAGVHFVLAGAALSVCHVE